MHEHEHTLSARILGFEIDPVLQEFDGQSKNVKEHAEVLNSCVVL